MVTSQAAGKPSRWSHHSIGPPPGIPPNSVSGVLSAGSLGASRSSRVYSGVTLLTAGSRRRAPMAAREPRSGATLPSLFTTR